MTWHENIVAGVQEVRTRALQRGHQYTLRLEPDVQGINVVALERGADPERRQWTVSACVYWPIIEHSSAPLLVAIDRVCSTMNRRFDVKQDDSRGS